MPVPSARLLLAGAAAAVLVGGAGAVSASAAAGDEVPQGVRVAGVDLGGLTAAQAEARLEEGLRDRVAAPVTVSADGEELVLDPATAGLRLDAAATARTAADAGLLDRLRATLGDERDVAPVVDVDESALRSAVRALAPQVDRPPREGTVHFTEADAPVPVPVPPLTGRELDVPGAVDAVRDGWLAQDRMELPVDVEQVETTEQEVSEALQEIATPAVAAPVLVDAGGDELVVPPRAIAAALRFEVDDEGELAPRLLPDVLSAQLEEALQGVGTPPVDATFDVSSGTPVVVPSSQGSTVAPADLSAAVATVLPRPAPRPAQAPLSPSQPRLTTEQAQGLGVREVISTFTTEHPCCAPRVQNIHRIADIVDGHVVLPGETFDLNEFVGPRDRERGFVDAPQILEGEFVDRIGGGISQFATTLFNAVFFAGLEDVAHSPHSYYISRYPPGREATLSYPEPDLIFKNDSPHGVLIDTSYTDRSVTVTFWGTERFDEVLSETGPRTRLRDFETRYVQRPDCTATEGEQGFDIVVTRVFVVDGQVVEREPFRTRYKPEPRFICGPPPDGADVESG